jgi:hypothetical protein
MTAVSLGSSAISGEFGGEVPVVTRSRGLTSVFVIFVAGCGEACGTAGLAGETPVRVVVNRGPSPVALILKGAGFASAERSSIETPDAGGGRMGMEGLVGAGVRTGAPTGRTGARIAGSVFAVAARGGRGGGMLLAAGFGGG